MPIDLYRHSVSSPCRAVLMAVRHLNLDINLKDVDIKAGEHVKPDYLKMNPQHTMPTLVDDGFSLWESRAIMQYLVDKYAPGHSVYPTDPKKRAVIDRLLQFDLGTLFVAVQDLMLPQLFRGKPPDLEKEKNLHEKFQFLEGFLEGNKYAAGDTLTLADFSLLASVTTIQTFGFDTSKYKNVTAWVARLASELPHYDETTIEPCRLFKLIVDKYKKY